MVNQSEPTLRRLTIVIALVIVCLRIGSLGIPSLVEPTDARYAQISAYMAKQGTWIMPYIQESGGQVIPYWSKPPLAFWLMAGSLNIFGHSVWSVRFPSAVAWALTALLIWYGGKKFAGNGSGVIAALLYMTTFSVYALAGTTLTDSLLTLCVTGSLLAAYKGITEQNSSSSFYIASLFFGLGVLVKGPVALIFPLVSIFVFALSSGNFAFLTRIPWIGSFSLLCLITFPWFILAELETPGYLQYFLMEENFKRFFSSSIELTSGSGHRTPIGFALILLPLMLLPWSILTPVLFRKDFTSSGTYEFYRYLLCWLLVPTACLVFGRHVLPTYLLPVIPAFTLLLALRLVGQRKERLPHSLTIFQPVALIAMFGILAFLAFGQTIWLQVLPNPLYVGLFVALCSVSLFAIMVQKRTGDAALLASVLSASFILTGAVFSSALPLNMFKSASYLIEHLEKEHHPSDTKVMFLNQVPLSALFLREGEEPNHRIPTAVSEAELMAQDCGIVVVRDKDLPFMSTQYRDMNWESVGRWRVLDLGTPHYGHFS